MVKSAIILLISVYISAVFGAYPDCDPGTWPNTETSICDPCLDNCAVCSDGTTCKTCNSTFFWDAAIITCTSCIENCNTCTDATDCVTCADEFFWDNTQCSACIADCDSCITNTECTACTSGFWWDSETC